MSFASSRSSPAFAIGGINYDPARHVHDVPPYGWRCFHCNEHFTTIRDARLHFGADPDAAPACLIKGRFDGNLVLALRDLERTAIEEIAGLRRELDEAEGDYLGEIGKRERAVREAEEQGYAKGLADGRAERVQNG
ncbi:MAG TPA: hypothetical protein VFW22_16345 [Pseudolabrys sp.]|nr:hypothetical protein [Pseudolabrys sp.]